MRLRHYLSSRITLFLLFLLAAILLTIRFWPATSSDEVIFSNACATLGTSQNAGATATPAHTSPPLYLGLDAYRHLDTLSYLELGDRVEGASSADTGGSNADSTHIVRVLPDGEHVLFDQIGPGIMTFMRMQQDSGSPWNLSLDGHLYTTVRINDLGQMNHRI